VHHVFLEFLNCSISLNPTWQPTCKCEVQANPNTPDVTGIGRRVPCHHLWCHVLQAADRSKRTTLFQPLCCVEIYQVKITEVSGNKDVVSFDVPVDNTALVEVVHSLQQLAKQQLGDALFKLFFRTASHRLVKREAIHVLYHRYGATYADKEIQGLDNVGVVHCLENIELFFRYAHQLLILSTCRLDRDNHTVFSSSSTAHHTRATLSQGLKDLILLIESFIVATSSASP